MTIDTKDAVRYLQMEDAVTDAVLSRRIAQLCGLAAGTIRPSYTWKRFPISEHGISSGGLTLQMSRTLTTHLRGCRAAYLMCGTLGAGFDAFMRRVSVTSGADALIVQAIGTAAIEKLMDSVEDKIRAELRAGETLTARYSPGYGDFRLTEQKTMLSLLDASRTTGISLTDALLMVPSKSVSAIAGVKH